MTNVSLKSLKQTRALSAVRVSWAGCTILFANRNIKETEGLVQFTKLLTKVLHLSPPPIPRVSSWGHYTSLLSLKKSAVRHRSVFFLLWKCECIRVTGCTEFNIELKINLFMTVIAKNAMNDDLSV